METRDLLKTPMEELGFDQAFLAQCRTMEFVCLEDVLVVPPGLLVGKAGFTYKWLGELVLFLESCDLLHLLQTNPGRTSG